MNKSSVAFHGYEPQSITLALRGFIDADMASDFRQMLSIACQHYKYSEVHLEVSSPGGQMVYMGNMIREMTKWKAEGVRFCTHAQTEASSAAAILMAFGSPGHRTCSPDATLRRGR